MDEELALRVTMEPQRKISPLHALEQAHAAETIRQNSQVLIHRASLAGQRDASQLWTQRRRRAVDGHAPSRYASVL